MKRDRTKSIRERAVLDMCKAYFARRGFYVSSIVLGKDGIVVRFPDGGPMGMKKCHYSNELLSEIERKTLEAGRRGNL